MVKITANLIRKRAEHNECMLSTLEEVSLHQLDIEKIEHIDNWCRKLKILYLQSNLIEKIENLSRLKNLEYLNLALNNIEFIEGLKGCENLQKLDLTVNFIRKLSSIDSLANLEFLTEIYLTGNPCKDYEGYREFVIASLPYLKRLDGEEIEKSERIIAIQNYYDNKELVLAQEVSSLKYREKQKINIGELLKANKDDEEFWNSKIAFTPETKIAMHERMQTEKENKREKPKETKKTPTRLQAKDGRFLNINQQKFEFKLDQDEYLIILQISLFKHMQTHHCDLDVQPSFVRLISKGKTFQLVLPDEVNCEKSVAERSQATGNLTITMPRMKPNELYRNYELEKKKLQSKNKQKIETKIKTKDNYLEFDDPTNKIDFTNMKLKSKDKVKTTHKECETFEELNIPQDLPNLMRLPPEVNRILYVRNLPYKISSEELYDIFGKYGPIRQIRVGNLPTNKGNAFVVYEDIFDAKNACDHLSGFNVCNRYLVVLFYQANKAFKRNATDKKLENENLKNRYNV
ncbi:Leucine-rich repeat-containing protein 6 [Intoshia linei]|uniref:Leucine-rich repeat-containing protein 6 n=1 Tax=Intoshia linei TaxID=1819745 RepID=A0A177B224_9BILA|nr:Leucine-rich repeat-containing protein 6 [Intoshia linei]